MKKRRKIKNKKKKWLEKEFLLGLFIVLFLIIIIGFRISEKPQIPIEKVKEGELGSFGILRLEPYNIEGLEIIGHNCSDQNLKDIWDNLLAQSSTGITIFSDKDSRENCNNSLMYKVLPDNTTYFIFLRYNEGKSSITGESFSFFVNASINLTDFFLIWNSYGLDGVYHTLMDYNRLEDFSNYPPEMWTLIRNRSILDDTAANNEYNSIFKIPSLVWNFTNEDYYINGDSGVHRDKIPGPMFYFINLSSRNILKQYAAINPNKTSDYSYYMEYFVKNVSMAKTSNIPDIDLKGSRLHDSIIKLENYFANLAATDENLTVSYSISNPGAFGILKNNFFSVNHSLDFNTSSSLGGTYTVNITLSYFDSNATSNNFNVNIQGCVESDNGYNLFSKGTSQNLTNSSLDICLNTSNTTVIEYYCGLSGEILSNTTVCPVSDVCYEGACIENGSSNHVPVFLSNSCDGILAIKNTNFKIDMKGCFRDDDNDSLTYRYEVLENGSWVIVRNLSILTVIPNQNWLGKGRFNVYGKDLFKETKGIVNFEIIGTGVPPVTPPQTPIIYPPEEPEFKIINPYPSSESLAISMNQSQIFSIGNVEYDSVEWYLDGLFIKSDSNSFNVDKLSAGSHTIKVEIKKDEKTDSKTWNLTVRTVEEQKQYIVGQIVFWLIIMIVCVLIAIITLLIKREFKKNPNK